MAPLPASRQRSTATACSSSPHPCNVDVDDSALTRHTPHADAARVQQFRHQLRTERIVAREALPADLYSQFNRRIIAGLENLLARLAPTRLGFCWPYRGEPDLRPLVIDWLAGDPGTAAIPVVTRTATPMVFRKWTADARMSRDRHGIPIPAEDITIEPDAVLIPLNVFDAQGYRLGYGGGYFDRTFAAMRTPPVGIGVAFELARTDSIHPLAHDHPMDFIVTEAGLVFERSPVCG